MSTIAPTIASSTSLSTSLWSVRSRSWTCSHMSCSTWHSPLPRATARFSLRQEYQLLSSGELQNCFKLAQVHYCKGRQVLRTNFHKSCLGALYVKDSEAASWYCDFQIQPADERVFKLSGDEYLVYTSKDLLPTRTSGAAQTQLEIVEGTTIKVPAGCNLWLEDHQIYGKESAVLPGSEPKVFGWRWDAKKGSEKHHRGSITGRHPRTRTHVLFQNRAHLKTGGSQLRKDLISRPLRLVQMDYPFDFWNDLLHRRHDLGRSRESLLRPLPIQVHAISIRHRLHCRDWQPWTALTNGWRSSDLLPPGIPMKIITMTSTYAFAP